MISRNNFCLAEDNQKVLTFAVGWMDGWPRSSSSPSNCSHKTRVAGTADVSSIRGTLARNT